MYVNFVLNNYKTTWSIWLWEFTCDVVERFVTKQCACDIVGLRVTVMLLLRKIERNIDSNQNNLCIFSGDLRIFFKRIILYIRLIRCSYIWDVLFLFYDGRCYSVLTLYPPLLTKAAPSRICVSVPKKVLDFVNAKPLVVRSKSSCNETISSSDGTILTLLRGCM